VGDLATKLGREAEHTVYEAEITRIILALHMAKALPGANQVIIAADNQAAIQALQRLEPSLGHYLLDEAHKLADEIRQLWPHTILKLRWVPGHKGVPGNEAADELAKRAAEGHASQPAHLPAFLRKTLPTSVSVLKKGYNDRLKHENVLLLKKSPRFSKLARIDPSILSKKFRDLVDGLNRRQQSILVQLRTGHTPLQSHLHKIQRAPSPTCPACKRADETVFTT
jgi:ribonuclease HI